MDTTRIAHPRTRPNAHELRAVRGLRLFEERGHEIERVSDEADVYLVPSSGEHPYTVDYAAETCTCPDHTRRGVACKHLYAVGISRATRRGGPVGEIPERASHGRQLRSCGKCGEAAGSVSAGTGRPLMRDAASGGYFHVNCRPGAVSFGAALADLEGTGG